MTYATIGADARRVSQLAFLRHACSAIRPTSSKRRRLWDVDFRTAVAQAELEDREMPGAYHRVRFARPDGGVVEIDTTRPELLPACVALVAHPDDPRYQPLFGTEVITPLFGVPVPVKAHALADPEKGTGVAMICTFGDITDVTWWRELSLPVRAVIQANGALRPVTWGERRLGEPRCGSRADALRPAGRPVRRESAHAHCRTASREWRPARRTPADHAQREVLRKGRPAARDHHVAAVVRPNDERA